MVNDPPSSTPTGGTKATEEFNPEIGLFSSLVRTFSIKFGMVGLLLLGIDLGSSS
jgi:hypothetical protein